MATRALSAIRAPRLAPAIPPPTITMSKSLMSGPRLRIRKARRLEPDAMLYGAFTEILLVGLAAILVVAAVIDVRTFTISNRLNLTVALSAPVYWLSIALPLPGVGIQLAAGAGGFGLVGLGFYAGVMGGGDVKIAVAPVLLVSP